MADTVSVTQADRDLRSAILKHIVDTLDRPCGPGDMIEDRQDALDQIIARHRLASTQPAPAFPTRKALEQVVHRAIVAWDQSKPLKVDVAEAIQSLLQGKQP